MNKNFILVAFFIGCASIQAAQPITDTRLQLLSAKPSASDKTAPVTSNQQQVKPGFMKRLKANIMKKKISPTEVVLYLSAGCLGGYNVNRHDRMGSDNTFMIDDIPTLREWQTGASDRVAQLREQLSQNPSHGECTASKCYADEYLARKKQERADAEKNKREIDAGIAARQIEDHRYAILSKLFGSLVGTAVAIRCVPALFATLAPSLRAIQIR